MNITEKQHLNQLILTLSALNIPEIDRAINTYLVATFVSVAAKSTQNSINASKRWSRATGAEGKVSQPVATKSSEEVSVSDIPAPPPSPVGPVVYNRIHEITITSKYGNKCETCHTKHLAGSKVQASTPIKTKENPAGKGKWHVWCLGCVSNQPTNNSVEPTKVQVAEKKEPALSLNAPTKDQILIAAKKMNDLLTIQSTNEEICDEPLTFGDYIPNDWSN